MDFILSVLPLTLAAVMSAWWDCRGLRYFRRMRQKEMGILKIFGGLDFVILCKYAKIKMDILNIFAE